MCSHNWKYQDKASTWSIRRFKCSACNAWGWIGYKHSMRDRIHVYKEKTEKFERMLEEITVRPRLYGGRGFNPEHLEDLDA